MHKYGATVEKIEEVLKTSESDIEAKTFENKLFLRNKNWNSLKGVRENYIYKILTFILELNSN